MDKLAKIYTNRINEYYDSCNYLVFLMLFSVANIGIYYLTLIQFVNTLLEFLDWNSYLAPAASMPKALLLWQAANGNWPMGVLYAALTLLPFLLSWLLTANPGKTKEKFRGWGFLPALIWYTIDTVLHLYFTIMALIADFSVGVLIWEVIGAFLRLLMFVAMIGGMTAPKAIRQTKEKLVAGMIINYAQVKGPEEAKKLTKEEYEKMTDDFLRKARNAAYINWMKSYLESLD